MRRSFCIIVATVLCLSLNGNLIHGQQPPQATDGHKILKMEEGAWDAKGKMWMPGADEPMEFGGTEVNKMIGDFWVASEFKGNFGGVDFVGHGVFGYDESEKQHFGTWVDSMSTHQMKMFGGYDADTKTMTYKTVGKNPDGSEMKGKNVVVYKDANTRVMTMYAANPEKEGEMVKSMEIIYTRKKEADKSAAK